jgi:hypothetical protein
MEGVVKAEYSSLLRLGSAVEEKPMVLREILILIVIF